MSLTTAVAVEACQPTIDSRCCLQMEYEDLLPFSDFTIRVPQSMIYRLPVIFEQMLENQRTKVGCLATSSQLHTGFQVGKNALEET